MQLFYQSFPDSLNRATPVVIIPGLFGSTSNWRSFARSLSASHDVYVIDQRNHGRSPHADTQTYDDMAADLLEFLDFHGLDKVVLCGHSMGGKTAMTFTLLHPDRVAKLAVLDIAPVTYQHSHAPFLDELLQVDLSNLVSRAEADRALQQAIPDTGTRLFLLQNLTGSPGSYSWRLNLSCLRDSMHDLISFPTQELTGVSSDVSTCVIHGARSEYVLAEHHSTMQSWFSNTEYSEIAEAGHWLHVEQPQAVLNSLLEFLNNDKK